MEYKRVPQLVDIVRVIVHLFFSFELGDPGLPPIFIDPRLARRPVLYFVFREGVLYLEVAPPDPLSNDHTVDDFHEDQLHSSLHMDGIIAIDVPLGHRLYNLPHFSRYHHLVHIDFSLESVAVFLTESGELRFFVTTPFHIKMLGEQVVRESVTDANEEFETLFNLEVHQTTKVDEEAELIL